MISAWLNPDLFNPVFWYIWDALHNPRIRKILLPGGSSAGKTAGICDAVNLRQLEELVNVLAIRKHRIHVDTTIKASFEASINRLGPLSKQYEKMEREIRVITGAVTTYAGMDDPEKVKGLESYDIIHMNELNQYDPPEWNEVNRRLRGRANQKIIADWNQISKNHWICKGEDAILGDDQGWIDLPLRLPQYEEAVGAYTQLTEGYAFAKINAAGDTLWINTTYRDNFWIVGHPLDKSLGFVDVHTLANFATMKIKKPNDYRIYGLGLPGLIKTGGELWKQFQDAHIRELKIDPDYPIHVSLDSNVSPYVTVSMWQVIPVPDSEIHEIRQVGEIDARSPDNTAFKATLRLIKWLERLDYKQTLFVYGDPAGNARTTVDDNGRSFFDKVIGTLQKFNFRIVNRVQKSPPAVARSVEFINDVYEGLIPGWAIAIDHRCTVSVDDYTEVKEGPNGEMIKKKVTDPSDPTGERKIELYGHFSDAKRYFIITLLLEQFTNYKNRSRAPRITSVSE
jgi:phage terminase large subunit